MDPNKPKKLKSGWIVESVTEMTSGKIMLMVEPIGYLQDRAPLAGEVLIPLDEVFPRDDGDSR